MTTYTCPKGHASSTDDFCDECGAKIGGTTGTAGIEARKAGDDRTATIKFGRAAQLAHESGNKATEELLATVVDIEDAATGTVRLRRKVEAADEMALDTRSTKTVRVGRAQ